VVNIGNTEVGGQVDSLKAMAGLTHVLCDYSQVRLQSLFLNECLLTVFGALQQHILGKE